MKQKRTAIPSAPTIEISKGTKALYLRFSHAKVERTDSRIDEKAGTIFAVDFDKNNKIVGIEVVGADEISIKSIREQVPVGIPDFDPSETRIRMQEHQLAEAV